MNCSPSAICAMTPKTCCIRDCMFALPMDDSPLVPCSISSHSATFHNSLANISKLKAHSSMSKKYSSEFGSIPCRSTVTIFLWGSMGLHNLSTAWISFRMSLRSTDPRRNNFRAKVYTVRAGHTQATSLVLLFWSCLLAMYMGKGTSRTWPNLPESI
jgi:hypothetical protein